MVRRRYPTWIWTAAAFGSALALAAVVVSVDGAGVDGLRLGVRATARWSFLFFWPSYVGGAMGTLFGQPFIGLSRHARTLGLAFVAALQVHVGLVIWLGVVTGQIPLQGGLLWFFLVALLCSYLLALLSFGVGVRKLGRLWRPLLVGGTTYILFAFGRDFIAGSLDPKSHHWVYAAEYFPFALLSVIAFPLRLAAFLRRRFGARPVAA